MKRIELPVFPIRMLKNEIGKFRADESKNPDDQEQSAIFFFLMWPIIYLCVSTLQPLVALFLLPLLFWYLIDQVLFVQEEDFLEENDITLLGEEYTASRGIPFAIAELKAIESLLWFNKEYLYDDWRPTIDIYTFAL